MYRNCSLHAPFKLSMFAGILLLYPAYSATQVKATHLKSELMPALVSFESLILERLLFAETLEASEFLPLQINEKKNSFTGRSSNYIQRDGRVAKNLKDSKFLDKVLSNCKFKQLFAHSATNDKAREEKDSVSFFFFFTMAF